MHSDFKILIVDNSRMVVQRLDTLLTELNCIDCLSTAHNYAEALEKLSAQTFNAVLLDTQLPGKNGFELLGFIKENYPDTKTIMITNQTSDFYRHKGERIGTDHFIDKSNDFEKLAEIIKEYSIGFQLN